MYPLKKQLSLIFREQVHLPVRSTWKLYLSRSNTDYLWLAQYLHCLVTWKIIFHRGTNCWQKVWGCKGSAIADGQRVEGLSSSEMSQLRNLLSKFSDVVSSSNSNLRRTLLVWYHINGGTETLIRQSTRRLPFHQRDGC